MESSQSVKPLELPKSAVGWLDALFALPVILGIFFALRSIPQDTLGDAAFVTLLVAALGILMGGIEIRRAPWRLHKRMPRRWSDIIVDASVKLAGFFAPLSGILFLYWLFPEYDRAYYQRFFQAVYLVVPFIAVVAVPYFLYVEWRLPRERGGAWEMAMFVFGRWRGIDWRVLSQYALGWLVKGFFLPIMFGDIVNNLGYLRAADWRLLEIGLGPAFDLLFLALINLELVFVTAGYVFACRLFDSHIRYVETTLFGWFIALISYGPFLSLVYVRYFAYNADGTNWLDWLAPYPTIAAAWGAIILGLLVLHLWCDACFGVRFSNLTHRGIVTNGPYRFSKHPAYVIKNIRWWMVAVPFIAVNWHEAIRLSLLLVCVNLVYTLRSYAEERMLSQDPDYVAYARWMERHGLLRFIGRLIPVFSYEWRLERWKKQGFITTPR